jgi:hypothetical protein
MASDKHGINFAKLNNKNYSSWSFSMMNFLMKEHCFEPIQTTTRMQDWSADMKRMDLKAWNNINLAVETCQHIHTKKTKGGREVWNVLKEFHVQTSLSARIRILKKTLPCHLEGRRIDGKSSSRDF